MKASLKEIRGYPWISCHLWLNLPSLSQPFRSFPQVQGRGGRTSCRRLSMSPTEGAENCDVANGKGLELHDSYEYIYIFKSSKIPTSMFYLMQDHTRYRTQPWPYLNLIVWKLVARFHLVTIGSMAQWIPSDRSFLGPVCICCAISRHFVDYPPCYFCCLLVLGYLHSL